jgi:hypothetical protein
MMYNFVVFWVGVEVGVESEAVLPGLSTSNLAWRALNAFEPTYHSAL